MYYSHSASSKDVVPSESETYTKDVIPSDSKTFNTLALGILTKLHFKKKKREITNSF